MTEYSELVTLGTIDGGATEIRADVSGAGDPWDPVFITLSTDYAMAGPASFPARPSFTGAAAPDLQYPRTVVSGTRFETFQCEADALVTAGAAIYS